MSDTKVMIVDDEPRMRKLVRDFLSKDGYMVVEAADGEEALTIFLQSKDISLIIMDVMMPKMDGYEACEEIRKVSQVPIILLTAKSEEKDELRGFALGVDEYITKPFSPRVLMARVSAILRRTVQEEGAKTISAGGIVLDTSAHSVTVDGELVEQIGRAHV